MNWNNLIQISIYLIILVLAVKPLGIFMAYIYEGRPAGLNVWFGSFEKWIYRVCGVKPDAGMTWKEYAVALMVKDSAGNYSEQAQVAVKVGAASKPPAVKLAKSFECVVGEQVRIEAEAIGCEINVYAHSEDLLYPTD